MTFCKVLKQQFHEKFQFDYAERKFHNLSCKYYDELIHQFASSVMHLHLKLLFTKLEDWIWIPSPGKTNLEDASFDSEMGLLKNVHNKYGTSKKIVRDMTSIQLCSEEDDDDDDVSKKRKNLMKDEHAIDIAQFSSIQFWLIRIFNSTKCQFRARSQKFFFVILALGDWTKSNIDLSAKRLL